MTPTVGTNRRRHRTGGLIWAAALIATLGLGGTASAQDTGQLEGSVNLAGGSPVHGAVVLLIELGQVATTDARGRFAIADLPPGRYEVLAQREHLTAGRQAVTIAAGQVATIEFLLELSPVHEEITVTATGTAASTVFEAFNAITTLDSFDLATNIQGTIGEVLENQPGVAKRSFGPGTSRPIIRGFDGDRVLVMQDGIRTGDLSAQSADHGVSIDPASLDRLEVVRGPATLLYGSSAVGGVVNAITPHETFLTSPSDGFRGQVTTSVGSADAQAGANGSFQLGHQRWQLWGGGGSRRTDDYDTPEGPVVNSATRLANGRAGIGYLGQTGFFSVGYQIEDGRYGVPFAGAFESETGDGDDALLIDLDHRRRSVRVDVGARDLGLRWLDTVRVAVSYLDWHHEEVETEDGFDRVGTTFDNESVVVRAEFDQRPVGRVSGTFGAWSLRRDYLSVGEEALAPPTTQTAFAAFVYEELDVGRVRVQFGGRLESNDYQVGPRPAAGGAAEGLVPPPVRNRDFLGASGSTGVQVRLGASGTVVATLTRWYRAPALEELYNFGPHVGNLTFEIGNPDLEREASLGLDLSVRHQSSGARGEVNVYVYDIDDFVFPALTGEVIDGLRAAEFRQGDSRFTGFDAEGSLRMHEAAWVNVGLGLVAATLTASDQPLPRIPPVQGHVSVDLIFRGLTVSPEWIWTADQNRVREGETTTTGASVLNVGGSYVWPRGHAAHIFSVRGYNLTNVLYRNHTSFIKNLAPEIGRGVRVSYSLRFF